jgi:hypothetical protein
VKGSTILGADRFVVGVNLPWVGYGSDFGASRWHPSGGLSARPAERERVHQTFAMLRQDGIAIVRVFVLCDGRSGIGFDSAAMPIGLDDVFFADIDALLSSARQHNLQLIPVLLDFHLCNPAETVNGVQLGGRAHLVSNEDARTAFIERVLTPIAQRYGDDERVAAWDVFNEPEWCLRLLPPLSRTFDPFESLQAFLQNAVDAVRQSARQPVTVGSAGTWQLDLVRPLGLDFYQVHWYERFGRAALEQPVSELELDRPVILGEFSGRSARVADVLNAAQQAGYAGAFAWSVLANDDQSGYRPEIVAWARAHAAGPMEG